MIVNRSYCTLLRTLAFDRESQLRGSCKDDKCSVCSVGDFFHELQ